ncbi:hypothetical protein [Methylophilus sp. 5]|uniref:hypothetical protein n=1 Tax=Methylophilus sp. 5 TaxID=1112274 RepID=UPI000683F105|nr:hypothetical protein [Methylophilus sp. 5]
MTIDQALERISNNNGVIEAYVLVREAKVYLDVGHDHYHPKINIRIWLGYGLAEFPYLFDVSHHVHTPTQATPYHPSRVNFASEEEAIDAAIQTTTTFLVGAINAGLEPNDNWLVRNEDF